MTKRENILKAINFETPDYIPMIFAINDACWENYPKEELCELIESHKFLFPDFVRPKDTITYHPIARKDEEYTDDFGCVWKSTMNGITGTVVKHPLSEWSNFHEYRFPDPSKCMGIGAINWEEEQKNVKAAKQNGHFTSGGLRHGHTFLQLCDIRGYENLMYDFCDDYPEIHQLIEGLEKFNHYIVKQYVDMGVDMISYAEDLGMQYGPMLSPEHFKCYIKPSYERLMKLARDKNIIVHMHSDGDIRTLSEELIDGGVQVLNLQDLVNGIDWIAKNYKNRVCIDLDIDRQSITVNGTPKQIDELIREEVSKLGSMAGGLMMIYGLYPGVPMENVKALMDAMEKYAYYFN